MRAKDRHTRIARTLGCLVVSMTAGAALLDWVQPGTIATAKPSIGLMAPLDTGSPAWQAIHVMRQDADGSDAGRTSHFLIDVDGRSLATAHWKNARQLVRPGEIRICLIAPARSNTITTRQWSAVRELVSSLQQTYRISKQRVVVDDTLALPAAAGSHRSQPRS